MLAPLSVIRLLVAGELMQHRRFCHIMCTLAAFILSVPVTGQDDADSATCIPVQTDEILTDNLPQVIALEGDDSEYSRSLSFYSRGPFAWSPNDRYIAAEYQIFSDGFEIYDNRLIQIYDLQENAFLLDLPPTIELNEFIWSPDSQHLAIRFSDRYEVLSLDQIRSDPTHIEPLIIPRYKTEGDVEHFTHRFVWAADARSFATLTRFSREQPREFEELGSVLRVHNLHDGSVDWEYETTRFISRAIEFEGNWWATLNDITSPKNQFGQRKTEHDDTMTIVNVTKSEVVLETEGNLIDIQASDNRLLLATYRADAANPQDGVLTVRDLETGEQVTQIQGLVSIAGSRFETFGRFLRAPGVVTDQFGTRGEITLQQIDGSISYSIAMDGIGVRIWGDTDYLMIYQIPSWFSYIDQLVDMRTGEVILDNVSEKIGASLDDPYSWSPDGKRMVTGYRDIEIWTLQCEE